MFHAENPRAVCLNAMSSCGSFPHVLEYRRFYCWRPLYFRKLWISNRRVESRYGRYRQLVIVPEPWSMMPPIDSDVNIFTMFTSLITFSSSSSVLRDPHKYNDLKPATKKTRKPAAQRGRCGEKNASKQSTGSATTPGEHRIEAARRTTA